MRNALQTLKLALVSRENRRTVNEEINFVSFLTEMSFFLKREISSTDDVRGSISMLSYIPFLEQFGGYLLRSVARDRLVI